MKTFPNCILAACAAFRTFLAVLATAFAVSTASADYAVDFEGATETKTGYTSGTVKLGGLDWNMTDALIGDLTADYKNGTKSARLRGYGTSVMSMTEDKAAGLGTLSFTYRRYGTDTQVAWLAQYSITAGASWTQVGAPFTATDTASTFSEAVNVAGAVRVRIIPQALTGTSNRRLNIDDILLTDFGTPPVDELAPVIVSMSPADNASDVPVNTTLAITFDESVVAATGNIGLYVTDNPTPVTIPTSSAVIVGSTATFTLPAPLAYSTNYHVLLDAASFQDAAGNPLASGITDPTVWNFTTIPEPVPTPPLVVRLSPANDSTGLPAGELFLEIEYDVNVVAGTGILSVFDVNDTNVPATPVATFDVGNAAQVLVEGKVVGLLLPVPALAGKTYSVSGPAGLFRSAAGNINSAAFGFDVDQTPWAFEIAIPDTTPPALVSTSPPNGSGASVSPVLAATFDEALTLSASPWTVTVFDVTANATLAEFTQLTPTGVSVGGSELAITLPAPLAFNNTYRVTLSDGIVSDAAGNPSVAVTGSAWEFTTGGPFVKGQVVISQVYGGGGNAGATLRNDYIELHNKSESAISLSGWSVQYASSAGTSWQTTPLTGSIQPGGYYLVQQAAGTGGTENLPTPDATGTLGMSGTNGKVALTNSITALSGGSPLADASISDFVGYGTANAFEGTAAAPVLGNALAAIRLVNGSRDTDNNGADFTTGTPAPRNSDSPAFFPTVDGSGTAVASNATPGSGTLLGSFILPSSAANQSLKVALFGSLEGETLTTASIVVPNDFGIPVVENVALAGPASAGASVQVSGQTVTVSGVTLTSASGLEVTLSGLTAPDVMLSPSDDGFREFTVSTAQAGGVLKPIVLSPKARVALPVASISTLRAVTLPSPKAYILGSEAVATHVTASFRNQHWIQDHTAGMVIDDQPFVLGVSYTVGAGISSLVGTLNEFQGLLQFNPIAAVSTLSSSANNPAPVVVTLAELTANPLLHQARLVRINGVSFQSTPAAFATESIHALTQGADTFSFRSFTGVDYVATSLPVTSFNLVGLVRRVGTVPADYVSARSLADFISPTADPVYSDWAGDFAGGGTADGDFDLDGVPNGLEYFFGVSAAGFTPTPGIVNGSITFPRDSSLTDVSFVVQTSGDLEAWEDVPVENLNLTDPNFIKYVLPAPAVPPAPFFVRIKVTVAAAN
jgi:hypothetical protein